MRHLPYPDGVHRVTALQALALIPPVLVTFFTDPLGTATLLILTGIAALGWEAVFARIRRRAPGFHGITTCLIVTVVLPGDMELWQILVATSLGVILGELIFGGRGFGFVSAATVTLALAAISFPDLRLVAPGAALAIATLPGLGLLLWAGLVSPAVIVAVGALAIAVGWPATDPVAMALAVSFGAIFLIADPVAAPVTGAGRWIYGALAGFLIVVFSSGGAVTAEAVVFAALLASVFAPLIDHGVVLVHGTLRRRRAHG